MPRGQVGKSQVFQKCDPQFSNCRDINRPNLMVREYVVPNDPQMRQRQKFADAAAAWKRLTPMEKAEYNRRAKRKLPLTGYNIFTREYLQDNQKRAG